MIPAPAALERLPAAPARGTRLRGPGRLRAMLVACALATSCLAPVRAARAQEASFPAYQGYVTDVSGVLDAGERARLEALSRVLDEKTSAQLAIAIVPTVKPLAASDYAVDLFTRWGVGAKGKDNGILVVVATEDRDLWIEVGYGLEGAVPDAIAHRIYRDTLMPAFRAGDFGGGLYDASRQLAGRIAAEYHVDLGVADSTAARRKSPNVNLDFSPLVMLLILLILFRNRRIPWWLLLLNAGGSRRGRHHGGFGGFGGFGGGGGGGGFGGFGGGMTGGGGAGGRW